MLMTQHRRITGKLVIATHNPGKLAEMRELLAPYGVEAVSAGELGLAEPDETGETFRANAMIKAQNPDITDDQIAFSIGELKEHGVIDSGDTLTLGIGAMTDARWQDFFDKMVAIGIVDKHTDYKSAYTLQFVNKRVGLNLHPQ